MAKKVKKVEKVPAPPAPLRKKFVFVGCGGVFYHAVNTLGTIINGQVNPLEGLGIVCIDPDMVEEKNRVRQWPNVGERKCDMAADVLRGLCMEDRGVDCLPVCTFDMVEYDHLEMGDADEMTVVVLTDSFVSRLQVHYWLIERSKESDAKIAAIYAGNTGEDGWALVTQYRGGKTAYDLGDTHPALVAGAIKEMQGKEDREGCHAIPGVAQTLTANRLTGGIICMCLLRYLETGEGGRGYWEYRAGGFHLGWSSEWILRGKKWGEFAEHGYVEDVRKKYRPVFSKKAAKEVPHE